MAMETWLTLLISLSKAQLRCVKSAREEFHPRRQRHGRSDGSSFGVWDSPVPSLPLSSAAPCFCFSHICLFYSRSSASLKENLTSKGFSENCCRCLYTGSVERRWERDLCILDKEESSCIFLSPIQFSPLLLRKEISKEGQYGSRHLCVAPEGRAQGCAEWLDFLKHWDCQGNVGPWKPDSFLTWSNRGRGH